MHSVLFASILFTAAPLVAGHGHVEVPTARTPGDAFAAVCGQQLLSQQTSDINGNVQGEMQVAASQTDYDPTKCILNMCKGFQYEDNTANVYSYTAGETVDFTVQIAAPHVGVMNVSVVDTASNAVIGEPLISESDYASNAHTIPANNTAFSVTIPDLGSKCTEPGACVLQWWWDATSINQTYESCVDFTQGGSGSSSGGASSSAAPASSSTLATSASSSAAAVPTSSAVATTSASSAVAAVSTTSAPASYSTTPTTSAAAASTSKADSCKRRKKRNSLGNAA